LTNTNRKQGGDRSDSTCSLRAGERDERKRKSQAFGTGASQATRGKKDAHEGREVFFLGLKKTESKNRNGERFRFRGAQRGPVKKNTRIPHQKKKKRSRNARKGQSAAWEWPNVYKPHKKKKKKPSFDRKNEKKKGS